jgi:hypothetical protein
LKKITNSILDGKESEISEFIVKHFSYDLFNVLGINTNVKVVYKAESIIENGDLDILIVDPIRPANTIILECKRIKVKIEEDQSEKVNKVEELKVLVGQVNDRIKRGFHKVYLTVLIVCDGRNKIANNIFFNHASSKTLESIYTHPYLDTLDPKAGLLFLEPSQLTAKDYNLQAGCGIYEMRKPTPQQQPKDLTKKINSLVSQN